LVHKENRDLEIRRRGNAYTESEKMHNSYKHVSGISIACENYLQSTFVSITLTPTSLSSNLDFSYLLRFPPSV